MKFKIYDNGGRRSGIDRRSTSYTTHIPERRSAFDRRSNSDRRKAILKALSAILERRFCFFEVYLNGHKEQCNWK